MIVAFLILCLPLSVSASIHLGTIQGVVTGAKGEPVAGARVGLEGPTVRETVSDSGGRFYFPYLPVASYVVSVDLEGYGSAVQNEVMVEASRRTQVAIQLPADPDEIVTLTEETSIADPTDLDPASTMDRQELRGTPLPEAAEVLTSRFPGVVSGTLATRTGDPLYSSLRGADGVPRISINGVEGTSALPRLSSGVLRESLQEASFVSSSSDPLFRSAEGELRLVTPAARAHFEGSFYAALSPKAFQSSAMKPRGLRQNELVSTTDLGLEIGGPLIPGRLHAWSFLGTSVRERNLNPISSTSDTSTTNAMGRLDGALSMSRHLTGFGMFVRNDESLTSRPFFVGGPSFRTRSNSVSSLGSVDFQGTISPRAHAALKASVVRSHERLSQFSGVFSFDRSNTRVASILTLGASYDRFSEEPRRAGFERLSATLSDLVQWRSWTFQAGIRAERTTFRLSRERSTTTDPRLTISRAMGGSQKTTLKAGFNRYRDYYQRSVDELLVMAEHQILPEFLVGVQLSKREYERTCGSDRDIDLQHDSAEVFATKRMSNRWMMRGFVDAQNLDLDGCHPFAQSTLTDAALAYGVSTVVEGPWAINIALALTGRSAIELGVREAAPEFFQADLRVSKALSIAGRRLDAFAELVNATNQRDSLGRLLPVGVGMTRINNQLARSIRIGGRVNF